MRQKKLHALTTGLYITLLTASASADEWQFSIGTGIYFLNTSGDGGFHVDDLDIPVKFSTDLDSDEVSELLESAFGVGGYAKKGNLTIGYRFSYLELEDSVSAKLLDGSGRGTLKGTFESTGAGIDVGYPIMNLGRNVIGALVGVRYTEQEYDLNYTDDSGTVFRGTIDDSWTDLVLGLTHALPLTPKLVWSSVADIAFGDTDGTYHFDTGLLWKITPSFSARAYGSFISYDYENGSPGDSDWYLYDTDEYGLGITVLYNF
jgi:hypothetical protein